MKLSLSLLIRFLFGTVGLLISYAGQSQLVPRYSLLVNPAFSYGKFTPTVDPADDYVFWHLAPEVGANFRVAQRFMLGGSVRYDRTLGDIEPFERVGVQAEARWYPKLWREKPARSIAMYSIRKRLAVYGVARYGLTVWDKMPENNRLIRSLDGLSAGLGLSINLTRWLTLEYEYLAFGTGPFVDAKVNHGFSGQFRIPKFEVWPERPAHLVDDTPRRVNKRLQPDGDLRPQPYTVFVEGAYGYAPDVSYEEENGEEDRWEHPMYYTLAGGMVLSQNFEAGAQVSLLDARGSINSSDPFREQFVLAGLFARYTIMPEERLNFNVGLRADYANTQHLADSQFASANQVYLGFSGHLAYTLNPSLRLIAGMNFLMTADGDRNTLALNHPEVRLRWVL